MKTEVVNQETAVPSVGSERNRNATARYTIRVNWHFVLFAVTGVLALVTAHECRSITYIPSLAYGIAVWGWWALIASALWRLGVNTPSVTSFRTTTISIHVASAAALGAVHLLLLWGLGYVSLGASGYKNSGLIWRYLINVNRYGLEILMYGFVFGIIGIVQHQMRSQKQKIKSLELERQLSAAQLRALQMQLEPHFLFNTLNAITSLMVQGRNKEAIRTMTHLSDFLRTTLQRKAPEKVPLAEELRFVESYLAIQQVRFAGRLEIRIDATHEAMDGLVPCFLLQPLVENAIQHGIAPKRQGSSIETCVKRVGDTLWMQVKDDGCGTDGPSIGGHGIGLQNIKERLAYFYPNSYEFRTASPATGGYEVTIQIPYERALA